MPTAQTTEQLLQAALQAPINNLVAITSILLVVVVIGIIIVIWKFGPTVLKQFQQLLDIASRLTDVSKQNADQIKTMENALAGITPELVKQTNSIDKMVVEVRGQSLDFRNYQTLVSDNMSIHSSQLEANTAMLKQFEETMTALPDTIRAMIIDQIKCADIVQSVQALRSEVVQLMAQQNKRVTSSIPVVKPPVVNEDKPTP